MAKYDFKSIAKALKSKYGMLPPGWDEELTKRTKLKKQELNNTMDSPISPSSPEPINQPKFLKYNQMAKLGLPESAILKAMEKDGIDPVGWVFAP